MSVTPAPTSTRGQAPATSGGRRERDCASAPGLWEVGQIWAFCGALALVVLATYARVPPEELYRVERGGLVGGLSRAVIILNFPVAIVAMPVLAVVLARLMQSRWASTARRRRATVAVALLAMLLCAITAVPGVVRTSDLDARPINALPALGVAIAFLLTLLTLRVCGPGSLAPPGRWDVARLIAGGLLALVSLPWFFADLGLYIDDLPGLGTIFVARDPLPPGATLAAVHLGHHHGADGLLLAVSALALSRTLPQIASARLRGVLSFALALMLVYGLAILVEDAWGEQVVKRGWTTARIPSVLLPDTSPAWAMVVLTALVLHLIIQRGLRRSNERARRTARQYNE
jgi:hypothetical protein